MPANESFQMIEATKGINSYYLTSDGSTMSYRTRVRTPSLRTCSRSRRRSAAAWYPT